MNKYSKVIQDSIIILLLVLGIIMIPFGYTYLYGAVLTLIMIIVILFISFRENKVHGKKSSLSWLSLAFCVAVPASYFFIVKTRIHDADGLLLLSEWAKFALFLTVFASILAVAALLKARH